MAHDVFISYAEKDKGVAEQVCRVLEQGRIKCWMAPRDLPVGADYEDAIVNAISASRLLVLIHSTHSNASTHVKREIQNACAAGSRTQVIPLRIAAVAYSNTLRYYLGSVQWLDASTPPLEAHLRRLVEHVSTRLPPREAIPPPPEPPQPTYTNVRPGEGAGEGREPFPWARHMPGLGAVLLLVVITVVAVMSYRAPGGGGDGVSAVGTPSPVTQPNVNAAAPQAITDAPHDKYDAGGANRNARPDIAGLDYSPPFQQADVTRKAVITFKPEPGFTEEARKNNVTGVVRLRAILAANGEVTSIGVVKGLPDGLTEKAISAARQIRFTPAEMDGRAVSQHVVLEYNFNPY